MHSARLLFCLLVLGSCCAQDVLSPIGVITVTDSKGKEISSLSVQQHSEVQILQCRLGNAMVDWDILPHNPQIIMRYGGSLSVLSDVLMPKTTFTIVASNREGNATLAFDIAVTPCEYGSFTLLEMMLVLLLIGVSATTTRRLSTTTRSPVRTFVFRDRPTPIRISRIRTPISRCRTTVVLASIRRLLLARSATRVHSPTMKSLHRPFHSPPLSPC